MHRRVARACDEPGGIGGTGFVPGLLGVGRVIETPTAWKRRLRGLYSARMPLGKCRLCRKKLVQIG